MADPVTTCGGPSRAFAWRLHEVGTFQPARVAGRAFAVCVLLFGVTTACRNLPANFASLSLQEKISTYECVGMPPKLKAREWISWHGIPAADAMAEYLSANKAGIPKYEAIHIIWAVQRRGCSIRGTAAHRALQAYLRSAPPPPENEGRLARWVLEDIEADRHDDKFDDLPPGPCTPSLQLPSGRRR
jgi:hypothetical protein